MYAPCTTFHWLADPEARTGGRWDMCNVDSKAIGNIGKVVLISVYSIKFSFPKQWRDFFIQECIKSKGL